MITCNVLLGRAYKITWKSHSSCNNKIVKNSKFLCFCAFRWWYWQYWHCWTVFVGFMHWLRLNPLEWQGSSSKKVTSFTSMLQFSRALCGHLHSYMVMQSLNSTICNVLHSPITSPRDYCRRWIFERFLYLEHGNVTTLRLRKLFVNSLCPLTLLLFYSNWLYNLVQFYFFAQESSPVVLHSSSDELVLL